ncbi:Trans-L-3-hydroxyproline dehydratase [Pseudocercospora fuligena]|uniref:trans-L-3-hydroxyproline dehydratase n=1 Tax=Pseudocercospora fuligena TaxID=685502 RepID=A0A8H6RJ10_9PEZI|nr:Trans-L-3-hydroxyproline dehydratase [Pseudocercospora fuligena]
MDIAKELSTSSTAIQCVDMHTTGEPTRIVYQGYPELQGTLLEQRAQAKRSYDHIRRRLILEPRGHRDMYGAILRPETEHTKSGQAHMGVIFLTNEGYSTMCGHATIALARFLIDTHDKNIFPKRDDITFNKKKNEAELVLHAPCGLVKVTVPTIGEDGNRSHPSHSSYHLSVPSFATGIDVRVEIPEEYRWPELGADRNHVIADFSYGGAFYCLVSTKELGFPGRLERGKVDLSAMDLATKNLKAAINRDERLRYLFTHPDHEDLGFLYSVIVVDQEFDVAMRIDETTRAETGICFFADQQIDRSPTGSGVAARVALAYAKDHESKDESVAHHSMVSRSLGGKGGFVGSFWEEVGKTEHGYPIVRVQVEGRASYIGTSTFIVEESDPLGDDGFLFEKLC